MCVACVMSPLQIETHFVHLAVDAMGNPDVNKPLVLGAFLVREG